MYVPEQGGRRRLIAWIAVGGIVALVMVVIFSTLSGERARESGYGSDLTVTVPKRGSPLTVFTYFYYWYDLPDGSHSGGLTDRPAEPDASYENPEWFKKQFRDMREAGIDVALAAYWGPAEPSSDIGLANMAQAADEMRGEGEEPPLIGLFLDTGLIGQWPLPERDLTEEANQVRFYDLVRNFYNILPRHQWALIDGRPPVWLWGAFFDIKFDRAFFDYISSEFAADFGTKPYIVGEKSWAVAATETDEPAERMPLDDVYAWGAAVLGPQDAGGNIVEVGPGFDERELDRERQLFVDREGGRFYERSLQAAIDSGKPFLAIESWNEFHEAVDIAESEEYGRQYIEITRRYVEQFRAELNADAARR